jgi:hypothetical protein
MQGNGQSKEIRIAVETLLTLGTTHVGDFHSLSSLLFNDGFIVHESRPGVPGGRPPEAVKKLVCVLFGHSGGSRNLVPPRAGFQAFKNLLDPGFHRGDDQKVNFSHLPLLKGGLRGFESYFLTKKCCLNSHSN